MTGGLDVLLRVLPAFLIVIGVPLGVFWWSRRVNAGPGQPLRVVAKATLGRNASVAVVNVGDHHYLVGASEHSVNLISELDDYETNNGTQVPATTAGALVPPSNTTEQPRMGFIRRIQQRTLRTPAPTQRPFRANR